jgi:hypothetical protein
MSALTAVCCIQLIQAERQVGRTRLVRPVGFHNLVTVSDLQRHGWAGGYHAACSYLWISPPKTFRR